MNLFIHGLDANIRLGNSYFDDKHATLKADYLLANPPFNDGSKGDSGWGADRIADKDPRLTLGGQKLPLSPRNANTMWVLHFLSHLKDGGTAGFVMATGELSNSETALLEVRKALVDQDCVDCIIQLTGQLFANTQIPCSLWFLSKNRAGGKNYRKRTGEVLFIDARTLGTLIPGSRKQKELSAEEVRRVADIYRTFKREKSPEAVLGFCRTATVAEIRDDRHALSPGRYVGSPDAEGDEVSLEELLPRLVDRLRGQISKGHEIDAQVLSVLSSIEAAD
jgi:type I restriction enzyme M protein